MTYTTRTPLVHTHMTHGPVAQMLTEWSQLCESPSILAHANAWHLPGGDVDHLDDIVQRAGFGKAVDDTEADHFLWRLVVLAEHDYLAARIVMQRIMPSVLSVARRRGRIYPGGLNAALTECVGSAWSVIRCFPHHRRTSKIAANLVRDTEYFAFVRHTRLKKVDEAPMSDTQLYADASPTFIEAPLTELEELLTNAIAAGFSEEQAALLRAVAASDDPEVLAASFGVSSRTIRARKAKAIAELRNMIDVLV